MKKNCGLLMMVLYVFYFGALPTCAMVSHHLDSPLLETFKKGLVAAQNEYKSDEIKKMCVLISCKDYRRVNSESEKKMIKAFETADAHGKSCVFNELFLSLFGVETDDWIVWLPGQLYCLAFQMFTSSPLLAVALKNDKDAVKGELEKIPVKNKPVECVLSYLSPSYSYLEKKVSGESVHELAVKSGMVHHEIIQLLEKHEGRKVDYYDSEDDVVDW